VKRGVLLRHLRYHGCYLKREGRSHSLFANHKTLVAIANKHTRILWAILAHGESYDPHAAALSAPLGSIVRAGSLSPRLVMTPRRCLPPELFWHGTRPVQAAICRPFLKSRGLATVARESARQRLTTPTPAN
jgi:hypothetical protein